MSSSINTTVRSSSSVLRLVDIHQHRAEDPIFGSGLTLPSITSTCNRVPAHKSRSGPPASLGPVSLTVEVVLRPAWGLFH